MKIFATALLSLVLLGASHSGWAFACIGESDYAVIDENGNKTELVMGVKTIEHSPKWTLGIGDPPLSIAKATSIAMAWAKKNHKRYDSVGIREVVLARYGGCNEKDTRWYYRFEFTPIMDGNKVIRSDDFAAVLMDGVVVGPTKTKK